VIKGEVFTKPCRDCGLTIWFDPDMHHFCDQDSSKRHQCKIWKPRPRTNVTNFDIDGISNELFDLRERVSHVQKSQDDQFKSLGKEVSLVLQVLSEFRQDIKNIIRVGASI
jgi:hypothetical protein